MSDPSPRATATTPQRSSLPHLSTTTASKHCAVLLCQLGQWILHGQVLHLSGAHMFLTCILMLVGHCRCCSLSLSPPPSWVDCCWHCIGRMPAWHLGLLCRMRPAACVDRFPGLTLMLFPPPSTGTLPRLLLTRSATPSVSPTMVWLAGAATTVAQPTACGHQSWALATTAA